MVLNRKALLTETRRKLHQIPELSGEEYQTQEFICGFLAARKISFRKIHTGVVADFAGENNITIALRADTDGLPMVEKAAVPYKSKNGYMHACGHDGHTAMLLTVCDILAKEKPFFNVRAIFQFGEEGAGGAEVMIRHGALDGVNAIYALHTDPGTEEGQFALMSGAMMAGAVEFNITFTGKESHCAEPEKGTDALKPLAEFLNKVAKESFNEEYKKETLLHIGKVLGGTARNIVAGSAEAYCTLRYFDDRVREAVMARISNYLEETNERFKTAHTLVVNAVYPPLVNTEDAVQRVKAAIEKVNTAKVKFTAEDFAFYTQKVSGCLTWLGIRSKEFKAPLHSDTFGFREDALLYGVELFLRLVEKG